MKVTGNGKKIILMLSLVVLCFSQTTMGLQAKEKTAAVNATTANTQTTEKEVQEDTSDTVSANGTESADPTREDAIAQILSMNPEDAIAPTTIKPVYEDTTYTKNIYFPQSTLYGIFSSTELFFKVEDYWDTKYVYAEIQYDVSQLVQGITSSMTFSVNNVPIESCKAVYTNGDTQIAYVKIPMDIVKVGYNSFSISTYARLFDEEGCIDDFSGANWFSVADTSYIRCGYETKDANHRIAYYPYPFMSSTEETGKGLSIAVSDQATDGEIAAAMNLMADLSTSTGDENNIQFCVLSDLASTKPDRTIIVSNYANLPEQYKALIKKPDNFDQCATVNFVDDANGNPLLIITSENDDCLLEAAYIMMDEDRVSQEKSALATVNLGSADVAMNSTALSQMVAGNYTVGDIIGSGLTFVGPFHQEQNIYLPFSEDYFLSDAGKVTLKFRYSDNLDFTRSMISVYWGEVPIASKKLEKENATSDELTFAMPADAVGTTAGSIRISFDLEIQDLICTPRQEQMPWAYVSDESTLFLPASTGIVLTFDLKPSPFRTDGKFNDLMLVVSDKPTTEELNLYAQVIGMYGEGVDPYGTFSVKRNSEFTKEDSDYNIITIGTYKNNKLIKDINNNLHFTYNGEGTKFTSNEQLILSDTYAGQIAILQLLESPFATNRGVLAVTGTTDDSLKNIETFMRDNEMRLSLSKDCVLVDSELETKAYQFISTIEEVEEPSMIGTLVENKKTLLFTIVATSIMLMMLAAVTIILIRIRLYHKKKDE